MRNDVAAFRDEAEHVYADMKAAGYNDELHAWGHNSSATNTPCSATYSSSWSDSSHFHDELFSRTVQSLFMTSPSVEEVKFIEFAPLEGWSRWLQIRKVMEMQAVMKASTMERRKEYNCFENDIYVSIGCVVYFVPDYSNNMVLR